LRKFTKLAINCYSWLRRQNFQEVAFKFNQEDFKMKKSLVISSLVAGILVSGLSSSVFAGPNHEHKHRHAHEHERQFDAKRLNMKRMMRAFSRLDLSEEQKTEIKSIFKQGFDDNKPKREEIQTLREQVRNLKHAEVVDEQALRATAISIANLRTDMMLANLQNRKKIEALLTESQVQKLQEMKEKRKQRRLAE
jgi:Spy/CpxP family protein refolding chaperone